MSTNQILIDTTWKTNFNAAEFVQEFILQHSLTIRNYNNATSELYEHITTL